MSNSVSQIKASECHGIDLNILNILKAISMFYPQQHWFLKENNVQYSHVFWTRRIFITKCTLRSYILSDIIKQTNKKRQLLPLAKLKLLSWFHYSNSFCWSIQILITFSSKMPIWWKQRQPFQYKLYIYIFSIFYKINCSKTIIFIYPKVIK